MLELPKITWKIEIEIPPSTPIVDGLANELIRDFKTISEKCVMVYIDEENKELRLIPFKTNMISQNFRLDMGSDRVCKNCGHTWRYHSGEHCQEDISPDGKSMFEFSGEYKRET